MHFTHHWIFCTRQIVHAWAKEIKVCQTVSSKQPLLRQNIAVRYLWLASDFQPEGMRVPFGVSKMRSTYAFILFFLAAETRKWSQRFFSSVWKITSVHTQSIVYMEHKMENMEEVLGHTILNEIHNIGTVIFFL